MATIEYSGGEFRLRTPSGEIRAGKVVLAAGNANACSWRRWWAWTRR